MNSQILNFGSHALQLLKRTETAITKNRFSIYWMTSRLYKSNHKNANNTTLYLLCNTKLHVSGLKDHHQSKYEEILNNTTSK